MAGRKKEKKFETAIDRLEEIVNKMENENLSLEESIDMFKEGMDLLAFCNDKLDDAEKKIKVIINGKDNKIAEEEFAPVEE